MGLSFRARRGGELAGALAAALFLAARFFIDPAGAAGAPLDLTDHGVVELEVGSADDSSARVAEDIAALVDDGTTRRVVTVLGEGSMQNLDDLKSMRGIEIALVQADVLDVARSQKLIPAIETLTYIAKLYTEEFHLLARHDIASVDQLAGQKVNFDAAGAGTGVTAACIFSALGIEVQPTNDPTGVALVKLAKGEIAALAFVSAKPAPVFRYLDPAAGLHFLSIPLKPAITAAYAPTRLTAADYPGLVGADQPVDTAAVETVMMAASVAPGSDPYRNLVNFVDAFFSRFPVLLEPGHQAKWHEVNLAAELPGWRRFPAAAAWLARNAPAARQRAPQDVRTMFERFLEERLKASGAEMTQQQKDDLFAQFQRWQTGRGH